MFAMLVPLTTDILSHNPYFNRWFSAIKVFLMMCILIMCHNPYFNRWFSAMKMKIFLMKITPMSQSLF